MRCKICDSALTNPTWNAQLGDWEVCTTCLEIINDVFHDHPESIEIPDEDEVDEEIDENSA